MKRIYAILLFVGVFVLPQTLLAQPVFTVDGDPQPAGEGVAMVGKTASATPYEGIVVATTSGGDWSVVGTSGDPIVTAYRASGPSGAVLSITYSANPGSSSRVQTLTVQDDGNGNQVDLSIVQVGDRPYITALQTVEGTYTPGEVIPITVIFNEEIKHDGTYPTNTLDFSLNLNNNGVAIAPEDGSSISSNQIICYYTVQGTDLNTNSLDVDDVNGGADYVTGANRMEVTNLSGAYNIEDAYNGIHLEPIAKVIVYAQAPQVTNAVTAPYYNGTGYPAGSLNATVDVTTNYSSPGSKVYVTLDGTAAATSADLENAVTAGNGAKANVVPPSTTTTVNLDGVYVTPNSAGPSLYNIYGVDIAGNISDPYTINIFDGTPPTPVVSYSGGTPTNQPMPIEVNFGEQVSNFATADVSVVGTPALGGYTITGWNTADNQTYNFNIAITPTTYTGTIAVDIPVNVCSDIAGNGNFASNTVNIQYDGAGPIASIVVEGRADCYCPAEDKTTFNVTLEWDTEVDGFDFSTEVQLSGVAASKSAPAIVPPNRYDFTVTSTAIDEGYIYVTVPADSASDKITGQPNQESQYTICYDQIGPLPTIYSPDIKDAVATREAPDVPMTIDFGEALYGGGALGGNFDQADVSVHNGTIGGWAKISSQVYSFNITAVTDDRESVMIYVDASVDGANEWTDNLDNQARYADFEYRYDIYGPRVEINATRPLDLTAGPGDAPIRVAVEFYELMNGNILSSTSQAGLSITYDDGTGAQDFSFEDLETKCDYVDFARPLVDNVLGIEGYYVDFSPDVPRASITFYVQQGADGTTGTMTDAAGNENSASNIVQIIWDQTAPLATFTPPYDHTAPEVRTNSPFVVTVDFGENVNGFTSSDINLGATIGTNYTVNNQGQINDGLYSFNITPNVDGLVEAEVTANCATDDFGNLISDTYSPTFSIIYDGNEPTPTVNALTPTLLANNQTINASSPVPLQVQVNYGEAIDNATFNSAAITFNTNGTVVAGAASQQNQDYNNGLFTFELTASGEGQILVNVPAANAQDLSGNTNNALASVYTINFDNVLPSPTIRSTNVAYGERVNQQPIILQFEFNELMNDDFDGVDVTITMNHAGQSTVSGWEDISTATQTMYQYTFNPTTAPGYQLGTNDIEFQIDADKATDLAGNDNTSLLLPGYAYFSFTYNESGAIPTIQAYDPATYPNGVVTNIDVLQLHVNWDMEVGDFNPVFDGASDVTVTTGGSWNNFASPAADFYTFNLLSNPATYNGLVIVDIPAGAASDTFYGNLSLNCQNPFSVVYDNQGPIPTASPITGTWPAQEAGGTPTEYGVGISAAQAASGVYVTVEFNDANSIVAFNTEHIGVTTTRTAAVGDINLISALTVTNDNDHFIYTFKLSNITGDGEIMVDIPNGTASDEAIPTGNLSPAWTPDWHFEIDKEGPTPTIYSSNAAITHGGLYGIDVIGSIVPMEVDWGDDIKDYNNFDISHISVTNASIIQSSFAANPTSPTIHTFNMQLETSEASPTYLIEVYINHDAACEDDAGNASSYEIAKDGYSYFSFTYDPVRPQASIYPYEPTEFIGSTTNQRPIGIEIEFDETIQWTNTSGLVILNTSQPTTAEGFVWSFALGLHGNSPGDRRGNIFSFSIQPEPGASQATWTATISFNRVVDLAGNEISAEASYNFTYDNIQPIPTVYSTRVDETNGLPTTGIPAFTTTTASPIPITVDFGKDIDDDTFDMSEVSVTVENGYPAGVDYTQANWGTGEKDGHDIYTFELSMTDPESTAELNLWVPANVLTSVFGTNNAESALHWSNGFVATSVFSFIYDGIRPEPTITSPHFANGGGTNNVVDPVEIDISFMETVKDFDITDVTITATDINTGASCNDVSVTSLAAFGVNTVYSFELYAKSCDNHKVQVTVPENKLTDIAGNINSAQYAVFEFTFDGARPTPTISTNYAQNDVNSCLNAGQKDLVTITVDFGEAMTPGAFSSTDISTTCMSAVNLDGTDASASVFSTSYTADDANGVYTLDLSMENNFDGYVFVDIVENFSSDVATNLSEQGIAKNDPNPIYTICYDGAVPVPTLYITSQPTRYDKTLQATYPTSGDVSYGVIGLMIDFGENVWNFDPTNPNHFQLDGSDITAAIASGADGSDKYQIDITVNPANQAQTIKAYVKGLTGYTAQAVAVDKGGNWTSESGATIGGAWFSITYDGERPAATIWPHASFVNHDGIDYAQLDATGNCTSAEYRIDFGKPVSSADFDNADINPTGGGFTFTEGSLGIVSQSVYYTDLNNAYAQVYSFELSVCGQTGDAPVVIEVADNATSDFGDRPSIAGTTTVTYDRTDPYPTLTTGLTACCQKVVRFTNTDPAIIEIDFGEDVDGFDINEVSVSIGATNPNPVSLTPNADGTYTAEVDLPTSGLTTVWVVGNVASDYAGNGNTTDYEYDPAAVPSADNVISVLSIAYDVTDPELTVEWLPSGHTFAACEQVNRTYDLHVRTMDYDGTGAQSSLNKVDVEILDDGSNIIDIVNLWTAPDTYTGEWTGIIDLADAKYSILWDTEANYTLRTRSYDNAGNVAQDKKAVDYDEVKPVPVLSSSHSHGPTSGVGTTNPVIPMTVEFGDKLKAINSARITIDDPEAEATVGDFVSTNTTNGTWEFNIKLPTPDASTAERVLTVDVLTNAATDCGANTNTATATWTIEYDPTSTTPSIYTRIEGPTNQPRFVVYVNFNDPLLDPDGAGPLFDFNLNTDVQIVYPNGNWWKSYKIPEGTDNPSFKFFDVALAAGDWESGGVVEITIPKDAVTYQASGLGNQQATYTISYDGVGPTPTISVAGWNGPKSTGNSQQVQVDFGESVADFTSGDVSISVASGPAPSTSNFSDLGNGKFQFEIEQPSQVSMQQVYIDIKDNVASDLKNWNGAPGNPNYAAKTNDWITFDTQKPTPTITCSADPFAKAGIASVPIGGDGKRHLTITVTWDEDMGSIQASNFDVKINGSSVTDPLTSDFTPSINPIVSQKQYEFVYPPTNGSGPTFSDGDVLEVTVEDALDLNSNVTNKGYFSIEFDLTQPTVTLSPINGSYDPVTQTMSGIPARGPVRLIAEFSEAMDPVNCNFNSVLTISPKATLAGYSGNAAQDVFTFSIQPKLPFVQNVDWITVEMIPDVATSARDLAGNPHSNYQRFSFTYDGTVPTPTLTSLLAGKPGNGETISLAQAPVPIKCEFNEQVQEFTSASVMSDVDGEGIQNAMISDIMQIATGVYTFNLYPINVLVELEVPKDNVEDMSGNGNNASNKLIFVFEGERPVPAFKPVGANVTQSFIDDLDYYTTSLAVPFEVDLTEQVYSFDMNDISVTTTGGTVATIAGFTHPQMITTTLYRGTFTVTFDAATAIGESFTVHIPENRFVDVNDNLNEHYPVDGSGNKAEYTVFFNNAKATPTIISQLGTDVPAVGILPITVDFGEAVQGLAYSEVQVSAPGNKINWDDSNMDKYYFDVQLPNDWTGILTINIPEDAIANGAGLGNHAAQLLINYDGIYPQPTITTADMYQNAGPVFAVDFGEVVNGFIGTDVTLVKGNGTPNIVTDHGDGSFDMSITPATTYEVFVLDVLADVASDVAGNTSKHAVAQVTIVYDIVAPEPMLASTTVAEGARTKATTIDFTVDFTEVLNPMDELMAGDIQITVDGALQALVTGFNKVSDKQYAFDLDATGFGLDVVKNVVVTVPANVCKDMADNWNSADTYTFIYDSKQPTPTITASNADGTLNSGDLTNKQPVNITVTFDEEVYDFTVNDFVPVGYNIVNDNMTPSAGQGTQFEFKIIPEDGAITVEVPATIASDIAGNMNKGDSFTFNFDGTAPKPTITSTIANGGYTNSDRLMMTVDFGEPVTDGRDLIDNSKIVVSAPAVAAIPATYNATQQVYTFEVTSIPVNGEGQITVDLVANVVADAAGNMNSAADQFVINYDRINPTPTVETMTITNGEVTKIGTIDFTVTFNEPVENFGDVATDVAITKDGNPVGAPIAQATGDPLVYEFSFDADANGEGLYVVNVPPTVCKDRAGNDNDGSNNFEFEYDITGPIPTISVSDKDGDGSYVDDFDLVGGALPITVDFDDDIDAISIDVTDLTVKHFDQYGVVTDVTAATANPVDVNTVEFVLPIDPATGKVKQGDYSVVLNGGEFNDVAGNASEAGIPKPLLFNVDLDVVRPEPTIILLDAISNPTDNTTPAIMVDFGEPVTGLTEAKVEAWVGGDALGINDIQILTNGAKFDINQIAEGTIVFDIPENECSDLVENPSLPLDPIYELVIDGAAPVPTITAAVANGATTSETKIAVTVDFGEEVTIPGVMDIEDYVDVSGADVLLADAQYLGNGAYFFHVRPEDAFGVSTIEISVEANATEDLVGNDSEESIPYPYTIYFDGEAPYIVSTNPVESTIIPVTKPVTVVFNENVTLDVATLVAANSGVLVNATTNDNSTYELELDQTLASGPITITIPADVAMDDVNNGNEADALNFTVDATAPQLVVTNPTDDQPVSGITEIVAEITNPEAGDVIEVSVDDGATWVTYTPGMTMDDIAEFEGLDQDSSFNITVRATDLSGNSNEVVIPVTKDVEAPEFEITNPTSAVPNVDGTEEIRFTFLPSGIPADFDNIYGTLDETQDIADWTALDYSDVTFSTLNDIPEFVAAVEGQTVTLTVRAYDLAGNYFEDEVTLTKVAPVYPIVTAQAGQIVTNAQEEYALIQSNVLGEVWMVLQGTPVDTATFQAAAAKSPAEAAYATVTVTKVNTDMSVFTEGLKPGTYVAYAIDNAGRISQNVTNDIEVRDGITPIAEFSYVSALNVVQFIDASANTEYPPVTSYTWEFGDGNTSNERNPLHTYANTGTYTVKLTVESANGTGTTTMEIVIDATQLEANAQDETMLVVYPNPSDGRFNLAYSSTKQVKDVVVKIMDINGRVVKLDKFDVNNKLFTRKYDISQFSKGLYLIQLETENSVQTKRIVIER